MIEPQRAPVRPRVICPESGEELPLEDLVRSFLERSARRTIHLKGDDESTTTALRHVALVFAGEPEVRIRTSPVPGVVLHRGTGDHLIIHCRLAPWGRDDWIEYLLNVRSDQCSSVIRRLLPGDGEDALDGSPSLLRAVLDLMAADESLGSAREAVLRHLRSLAADPSHWQRVRAVCLDEFALKLVENDQWIFSPRVGEKLAGALLSEGPNWPLFTILDGHSPLQLLVAADKLSTDLAAGDECQHLASLLLRNLVYEAARLVARSPGAMAHLRQLVVTKRWAMAASLLHATDCGWVPDPLCLPMLGGAYLRGAAWPDASLVGLVAPGADLAVADLRRADLSGANLTNANLAGACLQRALFTKGFAAAAKLARADLTFLQAAGATLHSADLSGADLSGAHVAEACLESAHLDGACLVDADLSRARLAGAVLEGADLSGVNFCKAKLAGVKLSQCRSVGATFAGANLTGCDLEGLELPAADFREADLTRALLTGTSSPDGRFDGARLCEAGLAEVDWERASLRGADLTAASFHLGSSRSGRVGSPIACEGSKTGFYTDDYDEQDFKTPEEIRKANLCFADLRGAVLDKVDLYLVDLRGALLDPEQEEHARRCGAILEARC
jgi:uncharacterized protein YjbI with pentapeptide repeats